MGKIFRKIRDNLSLSLSLSRKNNERKKKEGEGGVFDVSRSLLSEEGRGRRGGRVSAMSLSAALELRGAHPSLAGRYCYNRPRTASRCSLGSRRAGREGGEAAVYRRPEYIE